MQRIAKFIFFTLIMIYCGLSYGNVVNIKPIGSLPTTVQSGQTVFATYKVTSTKTFPPEKYQIIYSLLSHPTNVSNDLTVANACQTNPISPAGCILKLAIVGPVSGPMMICVDRDGQPRACDIPSNPDNFLNVKANNLPHLIISPSTTFLDANVSQVFTVMNINTKNTALNVTMTIPANVQNQLASPPVYNGCVAILPLGKCTITITAAASPTAQSGIATIKGTNTAGPAPTVAITTGTAPALTVSPPTSILGPNGAQQFIVTNTSSTIAAKNIAITIPTNVQGQLTSPPVYSGCGSIAPGGTCKITIAAVASPSAQSGTATIQGTNTAAPAPTFAITIGAAPALTVSPTTTILGQNGVQTFIVTNSSSTIPAIGVTITIPPNVQSQFLGAPVYNGCASIAPLGTCTITITAIASPIAQSGTATVQGTNTAVPEPTIAITTGVAPALTVSPPTSILGPNDSQLFIVTNTSTNIAAQNVTISIPANIQGQLAQLPVYSGCGSVAPLSTCTISITAVGSPIAQSGTATVQGTNTAVPVPTVAISTGAAPALTVSPPTSILGSNDSQQFIVVNTSTTIAAQNVTMTIPTNVQGQLKSPPIYSGCGSIAPLGTCTMTITAVASPSAQSGAATIQGTNTAAPAPTVAITTGTAPSLTVSPPTSVLGSNDSQQFIVTNTSATTTAQNVTMIIPANVQGQLTSLPVYSGCGSIAPLGTCGISITAITLPSAQSGTATIQGTNTAAPVATVAITTGEAPTLTITPETSNIPLNGIQQFTVTNTGSSPANNISMTISGNVLNQLTGPPIYSSGCASLLPGSSDCTITIQAVALPSGQSGVGTVQGTNTASPSPVASIFILPVCTVLGNATVTNAGNSVVTGGVCVSPGIAITGFPPGQTIPAGQIHSNDSIATSDHSDAAILYGIITGLPCGTNLTGQDLGGMTLSPGIYCFDTTAALNGTLFLNGSSTDQWFFQIGTALMTGSNSSVVLTGGATAGNVFWQVGSSGTLGLNTAFQGQLIANASLTLTNGVSNKGRLWVVNAAIGLDNNSISP